jgi:hypothetical protein
MLLDIVLTAQWVIWDAPLVTLMGSMSEYVTLAFQDTQFRMIQLTDLVLIVPITTPTACSVNLTKKIMLFASSVEMVLV